MKLLLTFRNLEIGKLYTGCWLVHNEPVQEAWLGLELAVAGIFCGELPTAQGYGLPEIYSGTLNTSLKITAGKPVDWIHIGYPEDIKELSYG